MADSTPLNLVLQNSENEEPWVINQIFFYILNPYLQPNTTLSPANVAQEIDKPLPNSLDLVLQSSDNKDPCVINQGIYILNTHLQPNATHSPPSPANVAQEIDKLSPTPLNLVLRSPDNEEPWVINQRLFNTLNSYIQPNATLSAANAAQEIDKLFPPNRPREEDEDTVGYLFEMWRVVISVAEQIPWKHPGQAGLVEVIQALKDLPGHKTVDMGDFGKLVVWPDLPLLGPVMAERGYSMRFKFSYCFASDVSLALIQPSI